MKKTGKVQYIDEPIRHFERPGKRVLDLRPHGVPFVPILSMSKPPTAQKGPSTFHVHRGCVEIVYCVRGANFFFETPERDYPFRPGMVFVSRDDEPHRLNFNPSGHFVYRVLVAIPPVGGSFTGLDKEESKWLRSSLLSLPRSFRTGSEEIRAAFEGLFASYDTPSDPARRSFALRTGSFELLRRVIDASSRGSAAREDALIAACVDRIEKHPEADYDFGQMSREARLPPGIFAKRFAALAGLTPQSYRNACRIRKACRLLEAGRSVTEVAFELGFCSASYFSAVFKRETGETPSARTAGSAREGKRTL